MHGISPNFAISAPTGFPAMRYAIERPQSSEPIDQGAHSSPPGCQPADERTDRGSSATASVLDRGGGLYEDRSRLLQSTSIMNFSMAKKLTVILPPSSPKQDRLAVCRMCRHLQRPLQRPLAAVRAWWQRCAAAPAELCCGLWLHRRLRRGSLHQAPA